MPTGASSPSIYKLKCSLYGLKISPRMRYQKFDTHILRLEFVRSRVGRFVYPM
jgi:hypothetical protein